MRQEKSGTEESVEPGLETGVADKLVPESLAIGSLIDEKYELLELLGKGANGIVYKARHVLLDQLTAIKFFDPRLIDSEQSIQRFKREAALLSSFEHPNIVKFQAYGCTVAGQPYMVLEYLEGKTLAQILSSTGPLKAERAIPLFLKICQGLAYAHEKAVLHRDLKPGNVMVLQSADGETAKLLDFGIFKDLNNENQKLTKTGSFVGSANYMSPEQCRSAPLDQRSDIYSLACLMYETLVGEAPMNAENELLIMSNQLNKEITEIKASQAFSKEIESIILRCLNKEPAKRYVSVSELSAALESARSKPQKHKKNLSRFFIAAPIVFLISAIFPLANFWKSSMHRTAEQVEVRSVKEQRRSRLPDLNTDLLQNYQDLEEWLFDIFYNHIEIESKKIHRIGNYRGALFADTIPRQKIAEALVKIEILRARLGMGAATDRLAKTEKFVESKIHVHDGDPRSAGADFANQLTLQCYVAPILLAGGDRQKAEDLLAVMSGDAVQEILCVDGSRPKVLCKQKVSQSLLLMAELERWRGNFKQAKKYALRAYEIQKNLPANDWQVESLLQLGTIAQLLGNDHECKDLLLKAASSSDQILMSGNTLDLKLIAELACSLNNLGLNQPVLDLLRKYYEKSFDSKPCRDMAFIHKELARAYRATGQPAESRAVLKNALSACLDKIPSDDCSDRIETAYIRALHADHLDREIRGQTADYLNKLKEISEGRYLKALISVLNLLADVDIDTTPDWQKLDLQLVELEKARSIPPECVELRFAQGLAHRDRAEFEKEQRCYTKAFTDCQLRQSLRNRCFLLVLNARQTESRAKTGNNSAAQDLPEEFYKFKNCSEPFNFFNRDISLKIRSATELDKAIEKHTKMLRNHNNELAVIIDDYADCALNLANEHLQKSDNSSAAITLCSGLQTLQKYRPTHYGEIARLLASLREIYKKTGRTKDADDCTKQLAQIRTKQSLLDPDETGWEPYRTWTR